MQILKPKKKNFDWKNIIDPALLTDDEAIKAFEDTRPGTPILVRRLDINDSGYYLIPYLKKVKIKVGRRQYYKYLTSGVMIIDAKNGYFKEASWTKEPADYIIMSKTSAIQLVRKSLKKPFNNKNITTFLVWQPGDISSTPYKPFWKIMIGASTYYVSYEGKVYKG